MKLEHTVVLGDAIVCRLYDTIQILKLAVTGASPLSPVAAINLVPASQAKPVTTRSESEWMDSNIFRRRKEDQGFWYAATLMNGHVVWSMGSENLEARH